MPELLIIKTGDLYIISFLQKSEERVSVQPRNKQLGRTFQENVRNP